MKRTKNAAGGILLALLALAAIACEKLDVVGNGSIQSFDQVLRHVPHLVSADAAHKGWSLAAPDGSARFIWSWNYAESPLDVALELDAAPFIAAGLQPERLPSHFLFRGGKLILGRKLGQERLEYPGKGEATPLASYEHIVKLKRGAVGYHAQLDHYGVDMGNGNLFEWAKDMRANDKDMVFVLNPAPFIAAGVDPKRIDGWVSAKVTVDDEKGRPIQLDKILKPFDLQ